MTTTQNVTDAQIHELAQEIARRLKWEYKPGKQGIAWATVQAEDGRKLHIGHASGKGTHVRISAVGWPSYRDEGGAGDEFYPHQLHPKEATPEACIAYARGIDTICAEIARRIMPDYARIWTLCEVQAKACQEYNERAEASWAYVCKRLGGDGSRGRLYVASTSLVRNGDKVRFEHLDVTAKQAVEIARVLGAKVKAEK